MREPAQPHCARLGAGSAQEQAPCRRDAGAHPDFRGRGLGAAAIRELARLLFGELGYHRLEAGVYGFNERGLAVVDSAGFVREGVKRRAYCPHGEWVDAVELGLLVEDFEVDA